MERKILALIKIQDFYFFYFRKKPVSRNLSAAYLRDYYKQYKTKFIYQNFLGLNSVISTNESQPNIANAIYRLSHTPSPTLLLNQITRYHLDIKFQLHRQRNALALLKHATMADIHFTLSRSMTPARLALVLTRQRHCLCPLHYINYRLNSL